MRETARYGSVLDALETKRVLVAIAGDRCIAYCNRSLPLAASIGGCWRAECCRIVAERWKKRIAWQLFGITLCGDGATFSIRSASYPVQSLVLRLAANPEIL